MTEEYLFVHSGTLHRNARDEPFVTLMLPNGLLKEFPVSEQDYWEIRSLLLANERFK